MKKQAITIIALILILVSVLLCGCTKLVEEDEEFVELSTWYFTSGIANNLIIVNHSEANSKFEMHLDKGRFWGPEGQRYVTVCTANNGDTVRWEPFDPDGSYENFELAYVDIIVRVDDNIVGYAVIKITSFEDSIWNARAEVVKAVTFPKVDNQYQKVTQKQVEVKIQVAKK